MVSIKFNDNTVISVESLIKDMTYSFSANDNFSRTCAGIELKGEYIEAVAEDMGDTTPCSKQHMAELLMDEIRSSILWKQIISK